MKTKVNLQGLDCPNCARALESEINKLHGVENAKLEFVKSTLTFESENPQEVLQRIVALTAKLEPNAKISQFSEKASKRFNKRLLLDCIFLALGIAVGLTIFFVKMPSWAFWTLYALAALLLGYKTYYKALMLLIRGVVNENLLITISVIGATFVSQHLEGLMVIALYSVGKIFEGLAVERSRKSIEKLVKLQPDFAVLLKEDGTEEKVLPQDVALSSVIVVKAGQKVALDGVVLEGRCMIDMQSLTGESVPVQVCEGQEILSGAIVLDGVLKIQTTSTFSNSTISKILNLVENATENKSKTETFISKITRWYTLGIVTLALLVWGIVWGVTGQLDLAIYRGLIFLVISCPCAFAISVPLSYFSGLGNASKHGVLIKGSNFLDVCTHLGTVAFDKTGTLTTGQFEIERITSLDNEKTEEDILHLCALGEQNSVHPLAKAITAAYEKPLEKVKDAKEIAGSGVEFIFEKKKYFVGRKSQNLQNTCVELFEEDVKIGEIALRDTIKTSSLAACENLSSLGIKTVLLSGDNTAVAQEVADKLKMNEAFGQLLPAEKYAWIEKYKSKKNVIAYVGDGINDAPSLALADVGISMGINGSPASIEASDIVLVDDNPSKIVLAIKIAKHTRKIVLQNIIFSAVTKVVFLALGTAGITGMLAAVFADVGVTLVAILNALRALKYNPNKIRHKNCKIQTCEIETCADATCKSKVSENGNCKSKVCEEANCKDKNEP